MTKKIRQEISSSLKSTSLLRHKPFSSNGFARPALVSSVQVGKTKTRLLDFQDENAVEIDEVTLSSRKLNPHSLFATFHGVLEGEQCFKVEYNDEFAFFENHQRNTLLILICHI